MIVDPKNITQYLPSVNFKVDSRRFTPYLQEAELEIVDKLISCEIADMLACSEDENLTELKNLASRAICVTAYLDAVPEMDLQLSEAGFVVASNEAVKPASKERVERLMESLKNRKSASLDNLLVFLVHNSIDDASPVKDWRGSRQFAHISQTPVMTLAEFKKNILDIGNVNSDLDWRQFYSLIPLMNSHLHNTVAYYISDVYIRDVMERLRDAEPILDIEKQVLSHIKTAIVAGAMERRNIMIQESISARKIMVDNAHFFPLFLDSGSYQLPTTNIAGTGGVSNFLF
ncbi:MAG: hypothetical protein IKW54_02320 [Bacteroidales bacterium]|nr:hypothetical protein [Bacteroidales bacterium]